jgi:hypothetical protein
MTLLETVLTCSSLTLLSLLAVSIYFNIKHGVLIIQISEAIEEALDLLDSKYSNISKVLEIPLFYDSPQIRGVVDDVRICRDTLLESAQILTAIQQVENEEKTDN